MKRTFSVRRSRAAGWARIAGGLAVPVLALDALGTRAGIVPESAILPVLAVGFLLAVLALALAGYALTDIWNSGAEGARTAVAAIVYAAPVLALLALIAGAAIFYPRLTDVTTDISDPPRFAGQDAPHRRPQPADAARQQEAYPDIRSHSYSLPLAEVHRVVRKIIEKRHWTVTGDTQPIAPPPADSRNAAPAAPEDEEVSRALAAKGVMTQSRGEAGVKPDRTGSPGAAVPAVASTASTIEATAPTPVFGFVDDVVVRLRTTQSGTEVDMRSASRQGEHDLGQNARRIRSFFAELDTILQPSDGGSASGVASAGR